jgi:hypothetical protein
MTMGTMTADLEIYLTKVEGNPTGRGRPYSLKKLVRDVLSLPKIPKRVTVNMRLRAYYALAAVGIDGNILDTNTHAIRLWKMQGNRI